MENTYSIIEIESAINFWRVQDTSNEEYGLNAKVRVLADLYGRMIFDQRSAVAGSALNDAQAEALLIALNHAGELP